MIDYVERKTGYTTSCTVVVNVASGHHNSMRNTPSQIFVCNYRRGGDTHVLLIEWCLSSLSITTEWQRLLKKKKKPVILYATLLHVNKINFTSYHRMLICCFICLFIRVHTYVDMYIGVISGPFAQTIHILEIHLHHLISSASTIWSRV